MQSISSPGGNLREYRALLGRCKNDQSSVRRYPVLQSPCRTRTDDRVSSEPDKSQLDGLNFRQCFARPHRGGDCAPRLRKRQEIFLPSPARECRRGRQFQIVAERADRPYCMWASDDDLWKSNFIETCLNLLLRRPEAAMACGTISNINRRDLVIRNYRGFSRFTSGNSRHADARTFLLDPEAMGRANFIYGLYRTAALQRAIAEFWDAAGLGEFAGDCVFLYGFLCRYPIVATDEVLLGKRMDTDADAYTQRYHPKADFVSPRQYLSYVNRHVAVAPTPQFAQLARDVLRRRRIESRLFKYLSKLGLVNIGPNWVAVPVEMPRHLSAFARMSAIEER